MANILLYTTELSYTMMDIRLYLTKTLSVSNTDNLIPVVDETTLNPETYGRTQALSLYYFDVPMSEALSWPTPRYVG
jgi:hypothetical protein